MNVSGYDKNYGETDVETDVFYGYKTKNATGLITNKDTGIASQAISSVQGYIEITTLDLQKQDGYYYYFKFSPSSYSGNSTYYTLARCNSLFTIGFFRNGTNNYYYPAWFNSWSSSTGGSWTYNSGYQMYNDSIYYFRVHISGTSSTIEYSTNGSSWINLATVNSGYIVPTTTNTLTIYSPSGPNTKLYTPGIYITDGVDVVYSTSEEMYIKQTSHNVVPLIRNLYVADYSVGGNVINYTDDGSPVTLNLYVADVVTTLEDVTINYNYQYIEDKPVNIDTFVDGYNFKYDSATNAITNGPKSYRVSSGISTGYFVIDPAPIQRTFSVTCYTSSESGYDFGGIYIGNTYMEMTRANYQNNTTLSDGSWLYRNVQSSATYTKTLDANKTYYVEFIYTKDGGGESGLDKFVISNITFKAYIINPYIYLMSLDDTFKQLYPQFANYEYVDQVSIPEHNIFTKEDEQWVGLKQLTFNVTNEDEFYTEIIER